MVAILSRPLIEVAGDDWAIPFAFKDGTTRLPVSLVGFTVAASLTYGASSVSLTVGNGGVVENDFSLGTFNIEIGKTTTALIPPNDFARLFVTTTDPYGKLFTQAIVPIEVIFQ